MKVAVVGVGQCGCRIADKFYILNEHSGSIFGRRIEFITDGFAINTDSADLSGLLHIPKDQAHRIILNETGGHGVGGVNQVSFEVIKKYASSIVTTILDSLKFHEADAVLFIASGGGGTGSGAVATLIDTMKKRLQDPRPLYALIVLPFAKEEIGEGSFAVINTATCLAAVNKVADAVMLVENERFTRQGKDLIDTIDITNTRIVENFIDLFCAGEEKNPNRVGAKTIDAGDIIASLNGLTAIGVGEMPLSVWKTFPKVFNKRGDFQDGLKDDTTVTSALKKAINRLSVDCELSDATKICYAICAPKDMVTPGVDTEIRRQLANWAPKAEVRGGDYPAQGRNRTSTVTLIISGLIKVKRVEKIYERAHELYKIQKDIIEERKRAAQKLDELAKGLPSLLETEED